MANDENSRAEQPSPLARAAALGLVALRWVVAAALLPLAACAMTPEEALLRDIRAVSQLSNLTDRAAVEQQFRVMLRNHPADPDAFSANVARQDFHGRIQWLYTSNRSINIDNSVGVRISNISLPCITPDAMRSVFGSRYMQTFYPPPIAGEVRETQIHYIFAENPPRVLSFLFLGRRCAIMINMHEEGFLVRNLINLARREGVIP